MGLEKLIKLTIKSIANFTQIKIKITAHKKYNLFPQCIHSFSQSILLLNITFRKHHGVSDANTSKKTKQIGRSNCSMNWLMYASDWLSAVFSPHNVSKNASFALPQPEFLRKWSLVVVTQCKLKRRVVPEFTHIGIDYYFFKLLNEARKIFINSRWIYED